MIFCHKNLIYLFSVITEIAIEISADFDQFLNQLDKTESTSRNLRFTSTSVIAMWVEFSFEKNDSNFRHLFGQSFGPKLEITQFSA